MKSQRSTSNPRLGSHLLLGFSLILLVACSGPHQNLRAPRPDPLTSKLPLACVQRVVNRVVGRDRALSLSNPLSQHPLSTISPPHVEESQVIGSPQRYGAFWWSLSGHPYSISSAIRSSQRRQTLLDQLTAHHISRLYIFAQLYLKGRWAKGLRALNQTLHRHRLRSYLLMGSPSWTCDPTELFQIVRDRLRVFQRDSKPNERFDGVYLDIEPHALLADDARCLHRWDHLTAPQKRSLLYSLLQVIIDVHALLQDLERPPSRAASTPPKLLVYLPVWLDHLNTPQAVWDSARQRDSFYQCLRSFTSEVTVAAYCRDGTPRIAQSLAVERQLLGDQLRVGLNVYHQKGSAEECQTWGHIDEVWRTADELRSLIRPRLEVDLESLTRLLDQLDL